MSYDVDVSFDSFKRSNPNMDSPYARLLVAILLNAIHDAVAAQSSAVQRRQAWEWLESDDVMINLCLSVTSVEREGLLRRLKYMRLNDINLKNMYTKRTSI
jgi:hypothetical protein